MELNSAEKMIVEMLQEKDAQAQFESRQRTIRFLTTVSERTGIPVDALNVNPETHEITDTRLQSTQENGHMPVEAVFATSETS